MTVTQGNKLRKLIFEFSIGLVSMSTEPLLVGKLFYFGSGTVRAETIGIRTLYLST